MAIEQSMVEITAIASKVNHAVKNQLSKDSFLQDDCQNSGFKPTKEGYLSCLLTSTQYNGISKPPHHPLLISLDDFLIKFLSPLCQKLAKNLEEAINVEIHKYRMYHTNYLLGYLLASGLMILSLLTVSCSFNFKVTLTFFITFFTFLDPAGQADDEIPPSKCCSE